MIKEKSYFEVGPPSGTPHGVARGGYNIVRGVTSGTVMVASSPWVCAANDVAAANSRAEKDATAVETAGAAFYGFGRGSLRSVLGGSALVLTGTITGAEQLVKGHTRERPGEGRGYLGNWKHVVYSEAMDLALLKKPEDFDKELEDLLKDGSLPEEHHDRKGVAVDYTYQFFIADNPSELVDGLNDFQYNIGKGLVSGLTLATCAPMCDAIEAANKEDDNGQTGGMGAGFVGFGTGVYRGTVGGATLIGAGCTYGVVQLCKGFVAYGNVEAVGDISADASSDFNRMSTDPVMLLVLQKGYGLEEYLETLEQRAKEKEANSLAAQEKAAQARKAEASAAAELASAARAAAEAARIHAEAQNKAQARKANEQHAANGSQLANEALRDDDYNAKQRKADVTLQAAENARTVAAAQHDDATRLRHLAEQEERRELAAQRQAQAPALLLQQQAARERAAALQAQQDAATRKKLQAAEEAKRKWQTKVASLRAEEESSLREKLRAVKAAKRAADASYDAQLRAQQAEKRLLDEVAAQAKLLVDQARAQRHTDALAQDEEAKERARLEDAARAQAIRDRAQALAERMARLEALRASHDELVREKLRVIGEARKALALTNDLALMAKIDKETREKIRQLEDQILIAHEKLQAEMHAQAPPSTQSAAAATGALAEGNAAGGSSHRISNQFWTMRQVTSRMSQKRIGGAVPRSATPVHSVPNDSSSVSSASTGTHTRGSFSDPPLVASEEAAANKQRTQQFFWTMRKRRKGAFGNTRTAAVKGKASGIGSASASDDVSAAATGKNHDDTASVSSFSSLARRAHRSRVGGASRGVDPVNYCLGRLGIHGLEAFESSSSGASNVGTASVVGSSASMADTVSLSMIGSSASFAASASIVESTIGSEIWSRIISADWSSHPLLVEAMESAEFVEEARDAARAAAAESAAAREAHAGAVKARKSMEQKGVINGADYSVSPSRGALKVSSTNTNTTNSRSSSSSSISTNSGGVDAGRSIVGSSRKGLSDDNKSDAGSEGSNYSEPIHSKSRGSPSRSPNRSPHRSDSLGHSPSSSRNNDAHSNSRSGSRNSSQNGSQNGSLNDTHSSGIRGSSLLRNDSRASMNEGSIFSEITNSDCGENEDIDIIDAATRGRSLSRRRSSSQDNRISSHLVSGNASQEGLDEHEGSEYSELENRSRSSSRASSAEDQEEDEEGSEYSAPDDSCSRSRSRGRASSNGGSSAYSTPEHSRSRSRSRGRASSSGSFYSQSDDNPSMNSSVYSSGVSSNGSSYSQPDADGHSVHSSGASSKSSFYSEPDDGRSVHSSGGSSSKGSTYSTPEGSQGSSSSPGDSHTPASNDTPQGVGNKGQQGLGPTQGASLLSGILGASRTSTQSPLSKGAIGRSGGGRGGSGSPLRR